MENFNDEWASFSKMLIDSDLTEGQKYWILLKLQSIFSKEIEISTNKIININEKLSESNGPTTKPQKKYKNEKAIATNYRNACLPLEKKLNSSCKKMIMNLNKLTPIEQYELLESIDSPYQCDNVNTRRKIRKTLCGFDANAKRKNDKK